jgi:hypothetical protein
MWKENLAKTAARFMLAGTLLLTGCTQQEKHIGGIWVELTPKNGATITDHKIELDLAAYPDSVGPAIREVIFTGYWSGARSLDPNKPGGWQELCDIKTPDHGIVYACKVNLDKLNVPRGEANFSATVYGKDGSINDAPNGTIKVNYEPTTS